MAVQKWMARARYLRWLDAAAAGLLVAVLLAAALGPDAVVVVLAIAAAAVALAARVTPLRVRWRPVSGTVGFLVSRALRPGDRAWYVRSTRADLVIVTARRGLRVTIAAPDLGGEESMSVRRTRVLVVPVASAA